MSHCTGRFRYEEGKAALRAAMLCLLLIACGAAAAQDLQRSGSAYTLPPGSMPPWAVPVLRLVSSTHVEPTTGIVISSNGFVLVPADFAGPNDEIIVLDGGTDIIRNGRPARIERKFPALGLQVLFVEGLRRKGVHLAADSPLEGEEIFLTAFPPAEEIAEGKPPLKLPASIVLFEKTGNTAISGDTRLPNVTGALVDSCGNLVGVSLADDVQSMQPSAATRYQWKKGLRHILDELQLAPAESSCPGADEAPPPKPEAEEQTVEETTDEEETLPDDQPAVTPDEQEPVPAAEPEEEEIPVVDILPPVETDTGMLENATEEAKKDSGWAGWPWLLAALLLFGLGFALHKFRARGSVEPDPAGDDTTAKPVPVLQDPEEEPGLTGNGFDSLLTIRGQYADGSPFEISCPVNAKAINVTVGRGDTDLRIESRAVSRTHVNLNGTSSELTVTDLGSSNGTSINGVPCLEGEILYLEPDDTLLLGDARCTVEITRAENKGESQS